MGYWSGALGALMANFSLFRLNRGLIQSKAIGPGIPRVVCNDFILLVYNGGYTQHRIKSFPYAICLISVYLYRLLVDLTDERACTLKSSVYQGFTVDGHALHSCILPNRPEVGGVGRPVWDTGRVPSAL